MKTITRNEAMDILFSNNKTNTIVKKKEKIKKENIVKEKINNIEQKKIKEKPRIVEKWYVYFFKNRYWFYFQKILKDSMSNEDMIKNTKNNILLHSWVVEDYVLACIVSKSKLKKYMIPKRNIHSRRLYDLPQSLVDKICTFVK